MNTVQNLLLLQFKTTFTSKRLCLINKRVSGSKQQKQVDSKFVCLTETIV